MMTTNSNGASLEDCHTNIFSLIDLNGLRYKKFKPKDNNHLLYSPIETHPILTTYNKCIEQNYIAAWRHEPQKPKQHLNNHLSSTSSVPPTPHHRHSTNTPINTTSLNPTNTNPNVNYELWVFGYGNQLKLENVVGDDLVEVEDVTWDQQGLSYESRSLLFKALHNLIEKSLIAKGFIRLGRWFVQPSSPNITTSSIDGSKSSLSFSFSFFAHGDSNICCTVDIRHNPSIFVLTKDDLKASQNGRIVRVALAPFGLNGVLNGTSHKDESNEASTTSFLKQWTRFHSLPKINTDLQPVIEVIVAGVRMRYPSECVFTTYSECTKTDDSKERVPFVTKSVILNNKQDNQNLTSSKQPERNESFHKKEQSIVKSNSEYPTIAFIKQEPQFNYGEKLTPNLDRPTKDTQILDIDNQDSKTSTYVPSPATLTSYLKKDSKYSLTKPLEKLDRNKNKKDLHCEKTKNNTDVQVYRPEICAFMALSSKWAPLSNILSFESLPPECIYTPASPKSVENIEPLQLTTPQATKIDIPTKISSVEGISPFIVPHQRLFSNLQEIDSIQLNLMLADSIFSMFKDHNFESCTLCVCNMSIKGSDADTLPVRTSKNNQTSFMKSQSLNSDSSMNTSSSEFVSECTCGFSAITNRHFSHLSGLFFEDELEVTNVLYDPSELVDLQKTFKKLRLSNYTDKQLNEDTKKVLTKSYINSDTKTSFSPCKDTNSLEDSSKVFMDTSDNDKSHIPSSEANSLIDETKIFMIEQLKELCINSIHTNSSLSKLLLLEYFRNDRHFTSCINYYAHSAITNSMLPLDKTNDIYKKYLIVKMMNRSLVSLRFSDYCELVKSMTDKLLPQSAFPSQRSIHTNNNHPNFRNSNSFDSSANTLALNLFSRLMAKQSNSLVTPETHQNMFIRGFQELVGPTLNVDYKGAMQLLEQLQNEEYFTALVLIYRAIVIFSSPVHDWQFLPASYPENNFDVTNLLKFLQPVLNESIGGHNKIYKDFIHQQQQHIFSSRDSPSGAPIVPTPPCQGPLTWRQFHQAAGRGSEDQCEAQPIPSILIGHYVERSHLAVSPFALKFWDKLLLEPYSPNHNIYYLVISPDHLSISNQIESFFKELSYSYELLKLGKHVPIVSSPIKVNLNQENPGDDPDPWFNAVKLDKAFDAITGRLKNFSGVFNQKLAKLIVNFFDERKPPYDPHLDRFTSNSVVKHESNDLLSGLSFGIGNISKSQVLVPNTTGSSSNPIEEGIYSEEEANKQSGIVIYIVDPFCQPTIRQNLRVFASMALFRCYNRLLSLLPEKLRRVCQIQLVSLDTIITHSRPISDINRADQLKSLSVNVYSRCRKILTNQITAKSLTGFGPAAALEKFLKTKNPDLCISKAFSPPYILAPMKDKQTELGEMFGDRREVSCVLFCSYCMTEDQKWLLASITNDKGEMSETTVINVNVQERLKHPAASVKRFALRKLMEFIISVMSEWTNPWRIVIGKLGRIGHGEIREWASILSKRSLINYGHHLTERCRQCSLLPPTETISILSACLVSLEPDSKMRIMPDQIHNDDRQASTNKCPLNTPDDVTATHILVFPTSASSQAPHTNVDDPLENSGLDDFQFPLMDAMEDLGGDDAMDDLFNAWHDDGGGVGAGVGVGGMSGLTLNASLSGIGGASAHGAHDTNADGSAVDEAAQLLQQPLALGYFVSTAKPGSMPNWFWSSCPHARNTCPVFLKSALHIHVPSVHTNDDLLHSGTGQSKKTHQLDSNLTTDVLRYVLEGYNALSWLVLSPKTYDRQSCLPVHMQNLLQLYHLVESFS